MESEKTTEHVGSNILNVIIEPTSYCNMTCEYCFKGEKKETVLPFDVFKEVVQQVLSYIEKRGLVCEFIWHGGEPTLMGYNYLKEAINFIEDAKGKSTITYSLQTNGTLLTDDLLELFSKYGFYLGISLDSTTPDYHEKMRPMMNGEPSHAIIVDGIERAKARGIDVGVLMALTEENASNAIDMFEFCQKRGVGLGLNPVSADSHSAHLDIELSPETYLKVCLDLFDLWLTQSKTPIRFNPAFGIIETLIKKPDAITHEKNCQMSYISIGPEGDIYPCNRFYGIEEYKFGSIFSGFENAMNSDVRKKLLNRKISNIEKCRKCSISAYCNGGCMHHAASHYGTIFAPDHLCIVYRGLVKHAIKRLHEILKEHRNEIQVK